MSEAFSQGEDAYESGKTSQDNPFDFFQETEQYKEWNDGYNQARTQAEHGEDHDA